MNALLIEHGRQAFLLLLKGITTFRFFFFKITNAIKICFPEYVPAYRSVLLIYYGYVTYHILNIYIFNILWIVNDRKIKC